MWNAAFDGQLAELESLFAATRNSIQFLKAAKERNVTPHELGDLIARMQAKQTAIMNRICECAILLGGYIKKGRPENGIVYSWQITVPSYHKDYKIVFDFARAYEPEIYDLALSHQFWLSHKKRRSMHRFFIHNDRDYNDCESVPSFRKYIHIANKYLAGELS